MLPAWLVWSTVGYLAKDFLPIPGLAKPPPAPASPPPQQPFVGFVPNAIQHEPPQLVLRAPIDPALPMDPGIDEETERAVLKALQDENVKDILGFAQSISHQGDPYGFGYYPQAASMLRYHARLVQQAKTAMGIAETQAKETQAKETQNRETPKTPAPTPTPPPPSETPTEPAPPDSEEPVEETTKTAKARAKNGAAVAKA